MVKKGEDYISVLGCEAAEVSNNCSSLPYYNNYTITLYLLEPIFTFCILNVPLDFQHFLQMSSILGLRPFVEAAVALWEWEEVSSQEKVWFIMYFP